ncbi:putative fluoride ion transporter CrcB [Microbacterium laevaniformans]|uniref:Fluoride-specific ion channel FluC n=1 Tax=Microbacterium laevaniformans TaxID=36807 RepID=A0A150HIH4_9MICO|nr:CrcB family protein [Microbacterium laevaniformans]KXZ61916.1 putative fluoride ion transporter CrcB [Microbacterium laevaniformans]
MTPPRWFSPVALALVILGGMIGVAIRAVVVVPLAAVDPHPLVVPAITLVINLLGSLLLGVIVGWFADRHPRARLFLGTGVMGGFTTYSAFAVQTLSTSSASPYIGIILVVVSLFGGVFAAVVGLAAGRRIADRPGEVERPEDAE